MNPSVGIDYGTSHSCIAVMENDGPRVIKPNGWDEIMPSAVYIDKRGRMLVGHSAYKAILTQSPGEGTGHMRYKIRMGQDDRYEFPEARIVKTAPQLGAIVIGELLKAYREETGEEVKAAVITVPAMFEQAACEGTREAARLAGLLYSPLLPEPIAAVLAYRFSAQDQNAQWMVFDLGGTLDVSLVLVRNGQMVVPSEGHAGDNRLGSGKFDRELFDYVKNELAKIYVLNEFSERNPAYKSAWGRLMLAVEQAKMELSKREETIVAIEGVFCDDDRGRSVKVEIPVTRKMYEKLIAPDVEKAVHICQNLLNKNRLSARDVQGLILLDGPTKTPYLKRILAERLNIGIIDSIDPMTVVAQGAAIYASTVEIPDDLKKHFAVLETSNGAVQIKLQYERTSKLPQCHLYGKIESANGVDGLMVEVHRADGLWTSGRLPVDENGMFLVEAMLLDRGKPLPSKFTTKVLDGAGRVLATVNEPEIWYPYSTVKPRLANSLRVTLKGNKTAILIKEGADLPAKGQFTLVTQKPICKGSKEDVLRIPILEAVTHLLGAEDDHAACNVHVGSVIIKGSDERVTMDVPQGSEIDLTIVVDESREIHAVAYIPLLNEDFEATFKAEGFGIKVEDIAKRLEEEKSRLAQVQKLQAESPVACVNESLAVIQNLKVVEDIDTDLARAKPGEGDACYRAWRRVLELSGALNKIWQDQSEVRVRQKLQGIRKNATDKDNEAITTIENELEQARGDKASLEKVEDAVNEIDRRIRWRPYYSLALHVVALRGVMMPMDRYNVNLAAVKLMDELLAKGAPETLTIQDLERLEEADRKLVVAVSDLDKHVAIFLGNLPAENQSQERYGTQTGDVGIKLQYERISTMPIYLVLGNVESAAVLASGLTIEFRRADGRWSSGRLPVEVNGVFAARVELINREKPALSQFTTTVLDRTGKTFAVVNVPAIWYPSPAEFLKNLPSGISPEEAYIILLKNDE